MKEYFILIQEGRRWNGEKCATVYVKDGEFFREQGGHEAAWGQKWVSIQAESINDARCQGHRMVGSTPPPWISNPKPDSDYR
jgi:hypothetical protein